MKTLFAILLFVAFGYSDKLVDSAFAETERFGIVTWEEPFQPQWYLHDQERGITWGLDRGVITGPNRIIGGSKNLLPPVLPQRRPEPYGFSSPEFQQDLMESVDRDLDRMLGLPAW